MLRLTQVSANRNLIKALVNNALDAEMISEALSALQMYFNLKYVTCNNFIDGGASGTGVSGTGLFTGAAVAVTFMVTLLW